MQYSGNGGVAKALSVVKGLRRLSRNHRTDDLSDGFVSGFDKAVGLRVPWRNGMTANTRLGEQVLKLVFEFGAVVMDTNVGARVARKPRVLKRCSC